MNEKPPAWMWPFQVDAAAQRDKVIVVEASAEALVVDLDDGHRPNPVVWTLDRFKAYHYLPGDLVRVLCHNDDYTKCFKKQAVIVAALHDGYVLGFGVPDVTVTAKTPSLEPALPFLGARVLMDYGVTGAKGTIARLLGPTIFELDRDDGVRGTGTDGRFVASACDILRIWGAP